MKLALLVPGSADESLLKLVRQMGVPHVVSALPPGHQGPAWEFRRFLYLRKRFEDAGLALSVIESIPMPDRIKLGLPGRDEDLDSFLRSLRNMGAAGIPILCYNWMPVIGVPRTSVTARVRGGAMATSYQHELMRDATLTEAGLVTEEQLWESLEYFLRAAVPVAEEAGVKLAMHPDDPPLSPIRGISRIMINERNFQRLVDLVPSPNNGITFCQGCFAEMGVDIPKAIHHFCGQEKVFFAHFRNLVGTAADFTETFHDEGDTDMFAAMRAYYEAKYEGPMRPDHVPTMECEEAKRGAYHVKGRLFAIGYMKGLMEGVEKAGI